MKVKITAIANRKFVSVSVYAAAHRCINVYFFKLARAGFYFDPQLFGHLISARPDIIGHQSDQ